MRLTIYRKMMLGFALIIAVMVALNTYTLSVLHSVTASVEQTLSINVRSIDLARSLRLQLDDEEQLAAKLLVSGDRAYATLLLESSSLFNSRLDSLVRVSPPHLGPLLAGVRSSHVEFYRLSGRPGGAGSDAWREALSDSVAAMRGRLDGVILEGQRAIDRSWIALQDSVVRAYDVAFLLTLGTIVAMIVVAFVITRTITRPIEALRRGTQLIARGEFVPIGVQSRDELASLAKAFNSMSLKLREIDQYKAEVMQHITHELRLPLQSLYSAHYLLRKQASSPVTAEYQKILDLIQENVDRISGFTNQFLDLSRIEAGKMEFRLEPVDLEEVVTRAVQEARVNAERKSIALTQSLQPVPTVMADLEKIHHAVSNLVGNAIKFTQNGGTVHVSLAPTSTGVRCSVRDTGVGIDPEDIPRLFTKFFQAKSAGKISVKGTGIGLALVKGIVEGHGGSVEVESVPGEGSTFAIHLPVQGSEGESTRNVRSIKEDSA